MSEVVALSQYYDAAETFEQLPGVRAVDVIDDDPRLDRPCIELVIGPAFERVPPRVHGVIRDHDMGTRPDLSGAQGRPRHWILVVV